MYYSRLTTYYLGALRGGRGVATTHYSLLTTYYLPPTTDSVVLTIDYRSLTTYGLLLTTDYVGALRGGRGVASGARRLP